MTFDHTKITFGPHIQEHVRIRQGASVVLLGVAKLNGVDVILGVIHPVSDKDVVNTWTLSGHNNGFGGDTLDLVAVGPKRKLMGWFNFFEDHIRGPYVTKEKAIESASDSGMNNYSLACVYKEIEFEEGEGL